MNQASDDRPVGVLALQGDFELHERYLDRREVAHIRVRRPSDLDDCSRLVIPGGESTTMTRLIDRVGLRAPLMEFAAQRPVLGTCAGLILLAREIEEDTGRHGVEPLGLLDILVRRNGFGRQIDSFIDTVEGPDGDATGVFIRAPRILRTGPEVEVIATWGGEPVGVRQGLITGLCYHPEVE